MDGWMMGKVKICMNTSIGMAFLSLDWMDRLMKWKERIFMDDSHVFDWPFWGFFFGLSSRWSRISKDGGERIDGRTTFRSLLLFSLSR